MKNKKANMGFLGIVLIVLLIWFFGAYFQTASLVGGTWGKISIFKISEDTNIIAVKVIANANNGEFASHGSVSSEDKIRNVGLGETDESNIPIFYNDVQLLDYQLKNVQIEGIRAVKDFQSGNEIELTDIRVVQPVVRCRILTYSNIVIDSKKDIRAQMLSCDVLSADLKAFDHGVDVTSRSSFFGGTKITGDLIVFKKGYVPPTPTESPVPPKDSFIPSLPDLNLPTGEDVSTLFQRFINWIKSIFSWW